MFGYSRSKSRQPSPHLSLGSERSLETHRRNSATSKRSPDLSSIKSGGVSSRTSEYGALHNVESKKWFKRREYLLLIIEAFLSLAEYVISERNLSSEELIRVNYTMRQALIRSLYWDGYSTILGLAIGVLADSYIRYYTVALATVILHFAAVSLVFMEETIKEIKKFNPYADVGRTVCIIALVLIKSSDVSRLVYGLQGMTNRKKSAAYLFVFLQFWVSSYATYGGVIVNAFSVVFRYTQIKLSIIAFFGSGFSLYLFVYFLHPEAPVKEQRGLACRVIGCVIRATYCKVFRVKRRKNGFFARTEGYCDRMTISRTKELLILYGMLVPTLGICFFKVLTTNSLFFITMFSKIKSDRYIEAIGREQLGRLLKIISMLLSYFGVWPLCGLIGLKKTHANKFLVGHFLVVFFMFYFAVATKSVEYPSYTYKNGFIRIFNCREKPVYLTPRDPDLSNRTIKVDPLKGEMSSYSTSEPHKLYAVNFDFNGTNTNFTMFLSVVPDETTGYIVVDPPEIRRIHGPYLPLREGPPGTNIGVWPRVYIYNTAVTLDGSVLKIKLANRRHSARKVEIQGGIMTIMSLRPGTYDFSVTHADVYKGGVRLEEGGVYGIILYPTTYTREIAIDLVVPPNTTPSWVNVIIFFLSGLAIGIGNPTLMAMVFKIAPHGLPTMSLCFVVSLEGLSMWISYIGFNTWHQFVTSSVLFVYAVGVTLFYFLCMFSLIKYKDRYQ